MKNLSGIESSTPALQPVGSDSRSNGAPATAQSAPPQPSSAPPPETSQADLQAAVAELQEALDRSSEPNRDVELNFRDDGQYVVEIRHRKDGRLLQQFPPENLLNRKGPAADLVGTVIDRKS